MKTARLFLLLTVCSTAALTQAETVVPHTFQDGTPAEASEVNENFDALAGAIDEGLGVAGAGHYLPYWFDANGKNLGLMIWGEVTYSPYSLIRVEGIDFPVAAPVQWPTGGVSPREHPDVYWTESNCSGASYFKTTGYLMLHAGISPDGLVIRDVSTTNENVVTTDYMSSWGPGYAICRVNSNITHPARSVNPGIPTSIPLDLGAVPPATVKWSNSVPAPYPIE